MGDKLNKKMDYIHYYHSPLGRMTIGTDGEALRDMLVE